MLYDIEKFKKRDSFNEGFWDDFLNRDVFEDYPKLRRRSAAPAVNIAEDDKEFILELISPGMCKEDYVLQVENDVLTITGKKNNDADSARTYNRREFYATAFERSFLLPEYVNSDQIAASCADGILTIHIPKEENRVQRKRSIAID